MVSSFQESLREELNPEQYAAVSHDTGPLLVFAGAGSGKTRVLAYRLAYLLATGKCKPWEVLAVTFTNKAAEEMRQRITSLIGVDADKVMMGTFHKICSIFLRLYGYEINVSRHFTILDDRGSLILIGRVMRNDLDLDTREFDPKSYRYKISKAKEELLTTSEYRANASGKFEDRVADIYEKYQIRLERERALDFDDLIMKGVDLLESGGQAASELKGRFKYVLVDEYQDINKAQYRFVRALASKWRNLAVVGDDDQSIYGFRGADMKFILNFKGDYPDASVLKLERNYRSTGNILKCANKVIERIEGREEKVLWTDTGDGDLIVHYLATNEGEEAEYCAERIERLRKSGLVNYGDCAVLYRTNSQSRSFEEVFSSQGIPHQVVGNIRFYERKEIKDIISYLQVIHNPWASVALDRIINNPTRGIGPESYKRLVQVLTETKTNIIELVEDENRLEKLGKFRSRLEPFLRMMQVFYNVFGPVDPQKGIQVYALMVRILEESGYVQRLKDSDSIEAESRLENISELLGAVKRYDETHPTEGLPGFIEQVTLISDIDNLEMRDDTVKLMTCHSAKGLEFDVVFFTGLEEGLFPHSRSIQNFRDVEEERRLCYVGITRAKKRLYLTRAYSRWRAGNFANAMPSRFLREMPPEVLFFESGDPDDIFGDGIGPVAGKRRTGRSAVRSLRWKDADLNAGKRQKETPPSAFKRGERVEHGTWGEGDIIDIRDAGGDYFVTVRFDDFGSRLLSENKAKLKKMGV